MAGKASDERGINKWRCEKGENLEVGLVRDTEEEIRSQSQRGLHQPAASTF